MLLYKYTIDVLGECYSNHRFFAASKDSGVNNITGSVKSMNGAQRLFQPGKCADYDKTH